MMAGDFDFGWAQPAHQAKPQAGKAGTTAPWFISMGWARAASAAAGGPARVGNRMSGQAPVLLYLHTIISQHKVIKYYIVCT